MARVGTTLSRRSRKLYSSILLGTSLWACTPVILSAADSSRASASAVTNVLVLQSTSGAEIGHTTVTAQLTNEVTAVLYVPLTGAFSDAEKTQVYKNLEETILGLNFGSLIGLDLDYSSYLSSFKARSKFKTTGLLIDATVQCNALKTIIKRSHLSDAPVYIVRDTSPTAEAWTYSMKVCLNPTMDISVLTVRTEPELQTTLLNLQNRPKGILLNSAFTVYNYETGSNLSINEIHDMYRRINRLHIDMAPFKAHSNLAVALVPIDKTLPAKLYVNVARLDRLGASLIYKNLFRTVSGTIRSSTSVRH